jgi:hypothetical protein
VPRLFHSLSLNYMSRLAGCKIAKNHAVALCTAIPGS